MYVAVTLYRVREPYVPEFLRIQAVAAAVYRREGALDDATFAPAALGALYGTFPFGAAIDLVDDEVLLLGLSTFRDRAHHDEVMARVDADPQIDALFAEVQLVLRLDRVLRGAFERVA